MTQKQLIAPLGACLILAAVAAVPAAAAGGAGTSVTVRVEGKSATLLAPTVAHTHSGSITVGGTPKGKCSARSGAGALDVATKHHWSGTYSKSLGDIFIKQILGETQNGPKIYWGIWVNNVSASTGACGVKLHKGDTILFAAAPYPAYPLGLMAPKHAAVGHTFTIKVVYYNAKGKAVPAAGATVMINGHGGKTSKNGTVTVTPTHAGTFAITATDPGYIRPPAVKLVVS